MESNWRMNVWNIGMTIFRYAGLWASPKLAGIWTSSPQVATIKFMISTAAYRADITYNPVTGLWGTTVTGIPVGPGERFPYGRSVLPDH